MTYTKSPLLRVAMISLHGNPLVRESELGSDGKGGQNVYVKEVGTALSNLNCDVTWFTRSESREEVGIVELTPTLRCQYVVAGPQRHINRDSLFQYCCVFVEKIDASKFDVLLTNYWLSGFVGMELKTAALPQAHIHHSTGAMKYKHVEMPAIGELRLRIEEMINELVDCVIHQTQSEIIMCKATNPAYIQPGVDIKRFTKLDKNSAKVALGFEDDVVNVLYAGRFAPQKGIPFAIEALKCTQFRHKFRLIGNTNDMQYLVKSTPDADFLGPKSPDELAMYMVASDVLIMPSLYEPFGIVAVEAMAAGCCLIVSATGGLDEIVKHGVNGYKVPPRDSDAIRRAFEKLLADSELMKKIRQTNMAEARKRFCWRNTAFKLRQELNILVKSKQLKS